LDSYFLNYLYAEECRWVSPKRRVGRILPEEPSTRWLVKYQATEDWQGQIEASLINLKVTKWHQYHQMIREFNHFLYGKEISPDIKPGGKTRLQVTIKGK